MRTPCGSSVPTGQPVVLGSWGLAWWRNRLSAPSRPRRQTAVAANTSSLFGSALRWWGCSRTGVGRLAVEKLADEVFKHHGRLGLRDVVAGHQVLFFGTGFQTEVLLAQQTRGQYLGRAVLGEDTDLWFAGRAIPRSG